MATVIDALMVTLGLDATAFKKGAAESERTVEGLRKTVQRAGATEEDTNKRWTKGAKEIDGLRKKHHEAATKQFKEQTEQGKQLAQGLNGIKTELLAMLAAFTGGKGLTEFFAGTIMGNAALGRQANLFGITAQAMSNWQGVAEAMGGTADDANRSLGAVNDILTELEEHGGTIGGEKGAILTGMGLSKEDFDTVDHGIENIATKGIARLRAMGRTDREIAAELGKLGISGPVASAMLDRTKSMKEQLAIQQQLNPVTAEEVKQAQDAVAAWSNLHRQLDRVGTQITTALMPALNMLIKGLSAVVSWASAHPGQATAIFEVLTGAVIALAGAVGLLALAQLAAEIAAAPWLLILGAIALALGAIVFVVKDVITYFKTGKSAFDWGPFVPVIKAIQTAFGHLRDAIGYVIKTVKDMIAATDPRFFKFIAAVLETSVIYTFRLFADVLDLVADNIRIVADLLKGDLIQAAKDTGQQLLDTGKLALDAVSVPGRGQAGQDQGHDNGAAATGAAASSDATDAAAGRGMPAAVPTTGYGGGGAGSVAERHNNPGNIMQGGHFATYATPLAGAQAMARQLLYDYRRHGQDTVANLINGPHGWSRADAPGNTYAGTMNYIAAVSRALGVGPNERVNFSDPAIMAKTMSAMSQFEGDKQHKFTPALFSQAAGWATGAGAAPNISSRTSTVNNTTTAHIGVVNINGNESSQHIAGKFWGAVNNHHKSAVVSHASGLADA